MVKTLNASGSVFSVVTSSGAGIVVKSAATLPAEVAGNTFLSSLLPLLPVPDSRLITYADPSGEWSAAKVAMASAGSDATARAVEKNLNRPFFQILEFVPGVVLADLHAHPHFMGRVFDLASTHSPASPFPVARWESFGVMLVADVLLNNSDRAPLGSVWDNDGNGGNVMFREWDGSVVGIDSALTTIDGERGITYVASVASVLAAVVESRTLPDNTSAFLSSYTGMDLSQDEQDAVVSGMIRAMVYLARHVSDEDVLAAEADLVAAVPKSCDWGDVWADGMRVIHVSALLDIIHAIREIVDGSPALSDTPMLFPISLAHTKAFQRAVLGREGDDDDHVRALVCQERHLYGPEAASVLENEMEAILAREGAPIPSLVIFPEGCVTEGGPLEGCSFYDHIRPVVAKYALYALLGSGIERTPSGELYIQSVLMDPEGSIVLTYRKARPVSANGIVPGEDTGVVDTGLGRIGVVICFDIENRDVYDAMMAFRPDIVLNPVHIPLRSITPYARHIAQWNVGLTTMAESFEARMSRAGTSLLRCDQPRETASLGSSLAITPVVTQAAPSFGIAHYVVDLGPHVPLPVPPVGIDESRSKVEQNTGARVTLRSIFIPPGTEGSSCEWDPRVPPFVDGRVKAVVLVDGENRVHVLDLAQHVWRVCLTLPDTRVCSSVWVEGTRTAWTVWVRCEDGVVYAAVCDLNLSDVSPSTGLEFVLCHDSDGGVEEEEEGCEGVEVSVDGSGFVVNGYRVDVGDYPLEAAWVVDNGSRIVCTGVSGRVWIATYTRNMRVSSWADLA